MDFQLHNEEGIAFPPIRPAYEEGELFFERFRTLIPRGARDSIIGEGGTGLIHLVRDELMDRVVALKLPHESIQRDRSARHDVIRETRQAIELTHPHIVRIHDFHEGRQGWGISMQYVRGKNLDEWRHEGRGDSRRGIVPYPVERIEDWVAQLCDALIYAHEDARMVHRDIKPKNLMLERRDDGFEKLLITDFGITQKLRLHTMMLSRVQPGTSDKSTMGTLPYMPWEQIQGAPASALDDVYAVGATIYELLTGRPPFYEGGYEQIRTQVEKVVPATMARRLQDFDLPDHGIPAEWEETVAACLAKRPQDRPQSVREIVSRLGLVSSAAPLAGGAAAGASGPAVETLRQEVRALQMARETDRAEIESLQGALRQSTERTAQLERYIGENQDALGASESQSRELDAELALLRQSLEQAQQEARRWKNSYDTIEASLDGEQQEVVAQLQADIGEKDRQLASALGQQEQLRRTLTELEARQAAEEQGRLALEAELEEARQAAGDGAAEIEARFQEELAELRRGAVAAQEAAAVETRNAGALVEQAEKNARQQVEQARQEARKSAEQAVAEARSQAEAARKEAARLAEEAKRAGHLAEQAKSELSTLKTRQTAPLMPLLYVLIGAMVVGGGVGAFLGNRAGSDDRRTAGQYPTIASLKEFESAIPEAKKTGSLISAGLFKAFLSDSGVNPPDWKKVAIDLSENTADGAPVTGVSWWVADSFCGWLNARSDIPKGWYFRIASEEEIVAAELKRENDDPPEWTSDPGDIKSKGEADASKIGPPSSRKIVGYADAASAWQIPSLGRTLDDKQALAFRVTLAPPPSE